MTFIKANATEQNIFTHKVDMFNLVSVLVWNVINYPSTQQLSTRTSHSMFSRETTKSYLFSTFSEWIGSIASIYLIDNNFEFKVNILFFKLLVWPNEMVGWCQTIPYLLIICRKPLAKEIKKKIKGGGLLVERQIRINLWMHPPVFPSVPSVPTCAPTCVPQNFAMCSVQLQQLLLFGKMAPNLMSLHLHPLYFKFEMHRNNVFGLMGAHATHI